MIQVLQELQLTRSCQFYLPKKRITKKFIENLFEEASKKKVARYVTRNIREKNRNQIDFDYSVVVFRTEKPVYFLSSNDFKDVVYAYCVVIEVDGYIAILKKSCAPISEYIDTHLELLNFNSLLNTFDENTEFQRLSVRNMTISNKAIRSKTFEADNLDGAMSLHTAGKSIPYHVKINNKGTIQSINLSSGKLNELNEREKIIDLAKWIKGQILKFGNSSNSDFLKNFSQPIDFSSISVVSPISIMIELTDLEGYFFDPQNEIKIKLNNGQKKLLKNKNILYNFLSKTYSIDDSLNLEGFSFELIKKNNKSFTLDSQFLKKFFVIDHSGIERSLLQIINTKKSYSICFDDFQFMYSRGRGYKDTSGINQIDSLLDILIIKNELTSVSSEKGDLDESYTDFVDTSLFKKVENMYSSADYILCDDLGVEWCDHIVLDKDKKTIEFIHSKHKNVSNSASYLHEVVGQAIKNLGYLWFTDQQINKKIQTKFTEVYKGQNVVSNIPRCRKGQLSNLNNFLNDLYKEPYIVRKCVICCSFLSKSKLIPEFEKLKRGEKVAGQIPQIFWILSSLVHAAKELNITPEIFCQP